MYVQLILLIISFLAIHLFNSRSISQTQKSKSRINYINFVCVLLILQSALRNLAVGPDTYVYFQNFEGIKHMSWSQIIEQFYARYFNGNGTTDVGYIILQKIFQLFFLDFRIFLFFVAVFFFVPFGRLLKRFTFSKTDVFIALLIYQAFYYDFFSVTGIRQTLATSVTFFSIPYILNRKIYKFLTLIVVASLLHKSVLAFLPFYFLALFNKPKVLILSSMLSFPVLLLFAKKFAIFLVNISGSTKYQAYADSFFGGNGGAFYFTLFFFFLSFVVWILLLYNRISINDKYNLLMINSIGIALIFLPLTWVDPTLIRLAQYFSVFAIFLVPRVLKIVSNSKWTYVLMRTCTILIFLVIIIKHNSAYEFFWTPMALSEYYGFSMIIEGW